MRRIRIVDAAADEAAEAAAWYEAQRRGLGDEFQRAVEAALDLLEDEAVPLVPMPGAVARLGVKRLILRRFPYDVVVREAGDELVVIAFAHHSRRPGYWRRRPVR
jgi:toxin ParE1/3/4